MKLNPDKDYVRDMREAIAKNSGFCPCIIKKSADSRCPCKDFIDKKICHCNLYVPEYLDIVQKFKTSASQEDKTFIELCCAMQILGKDLWNKVIVTLEKYLTKDEIDIFLERKK